MIVWYFTTEYDSDMAVLGNDSKTIDVLIVRKTMTIRRRPENCLANRLRSVDDKKASVSTVIAVKPHGHVQANPCHQAGGIHQASP